jgi:hypothetical protein
MRRPTLAVLLSATLLFALCLRVQRPSIALAHPWGPSVPYTVSVEDESGNALRTFHKSGQTFVLGSYGQRYNIKVHNQTGQRVEAVVSVDGRDVVSGRIGDYVHERGYLIEPYGALEIQGFRRNVDEIAAFRFTSPGDSYSARMGTPQNVGVIGVAFFPERERPRRRQPVLARPEPRASYDGLSDAPSARGKASAGLGSAGGAAAERSAQPASAPAAAAPSSQGAYDKADEAMAEADGAESKHNLGTQYGETHESHVQEVEFRRADAWHPAQLIALHYDDERGLLARGIRVHEPPVLSCDEPNPFPRNRFAPPPP